MRLALALVLAIIATVHNAGTSAQKATPEVRTLSGQWTFSAEGYVMPLSLRQDGTKVTGTLELFNIFNAEASDIDYFYASRLPGEPFEGRRPSRSELEESFAKNPRLQPAHL